MQIAHFRYKRYLHRTKIIALSGLFIGHLAFGQKAPQTLHRLESDQKILKYGFFLGVHQNYYGIRYADTFETSAYEDIHSITARKKIGLNLGFMLNFRLADQFSIRAVPVKIAIYQHIVDYNYTDGTVDAQLIESTRVEPGLFIKYRSIRRGNTRMYLIAGLSGSARSGKADEGTNIEKLEIRKFNLKAEIGIGLERYFRFFKFSPELRYSRGLINVLHSNNSLFSNGIGRVTTHNFAFYLHFSD